MPHRDDPVHPTTVKTTEAQLLLRDIETKNNRLRAVGLVLLFVTSVGVIAAVILAAVIFDRQRDERDAEARRRTAQATAGAAVLTDVYDRLNHVDQLLSEHVGQEPLPPLQIPSTTTTTTAPRRAARTSSSPATTTTARPRATTTTSTTASPAPEPDPAPPSTTTTTTAPPRPCTTQPILGCLPTDP